MELSDALVAAVKAAGSAVVRVDGRRHGSASGVVWSPDGTIVTAAHGLDGDDEVEVGLASGDTAGARVVGRDGSTDVAVIRIEAGALPAPAWSDAALEVGQLVLSVTRPGRGPKAALGLVSRLGDAWRTASGGKVDRWVELDLALHPGFSGGLVLDLAGRGVGIATAGLARGTPLALPVATLRRVVKSILAHGGVRRGYLGIATLPAGLSAQLANQIGRRSALLVTAVEEDSPAGRAGLAVGDLLLSVDGTAVAELGDLLPLLEEERIGDVTRAQVARGGALHEVQLTIGVRGARGEGSCRP
jgi:S1-C subfamily serine protease